MKLFKRKSDLVPWLGKLTLLAALLLPGACVSLRGARPEPPPLLSPEPAVRVDDVDVLALSPEMEQFLQRYVLKYSNPQTRLYLLMDSVSSNGVLGFRYAESLSLTASEAFERRAGNCVGFANMMVALARRAGLKAEYQEVMRRPEWSSREDTLVVMKHINVLVHSPKYTYVLDVSGIENGSDMRRRTITDEYAKALYLNNIGVEALLEKDLPRAHAYMSRAIAAEPEITDPWVNLGVVLGRNEQTVEAATAFRRALEIDPSQYSAMSNLYELYLEAGNLEAAQDLHGRVEKYRRKNPYYLLRLSDEALEQARFEESIDLLQAAIRTKENDHLLHFALAKTQYLSGAIAEAESSLSRARELAPESELSWYERPLKELMEEE